MHRPPALPTVVRRQDHSELADQQRPAVGGEHHVVELRVEALRHQRAPVDRHRLPGLPRRGGPQHRAELAHRERDTVGALRDREQPLVRRRRDRRPPRAIGAFEDRPHLPHRDRAARTERDIEQAQAAVRSGIGLPRRTAVEAAQDQPVRADRHRLAVGDVDREQRVVSDAGAQQFGPWRAIRGRGHAAAGHRAPGQHGRSCRLSEHPHPLATPPNVPTGFAAEPVAGPQHACAAAACAPNPNQTLPPHP